MAPLRPGASGGSEAAPARCTYKVVLVGEPGAGKSAFAHRAAHGAFDDGYRPTTVDFQSVALELPRGQHVTLQLWDVGGTTPVSSPLLSTYLSNCQAVLAMYDCTSSEGFAGVLAWLDAVRAAATTAAGAGGTTPVLPYMALVACKADLAGERAVGVEEHLHLAQQLGLYSYSTSSLSGDGVKATLYRLAADLAGVPLSEAELEALAGPSGEMTAAHSSLVGGPVHTGAHQGQGQGHSGRFAAYSQAAPGAEGGSGRDSSPTAASGGGLQQPAASGKRPMLRGGLTASSGRRLPVLDSCPSPTGRPSLSAASPKAALPLPLHAQAAALPWVAVDQRAGLAAGRSCGGAGGEGKVSSNGVGGGGGGVEAKVLDWEGSGGGDLGRKGGSEGQKQGSRSRTPSPVQGEHEISGVHRRSTAPSLWSCCFG